MTLPAIVLVGIGGAIGALLRHAVGAAVPDGRFRLGTVTVNVAGTFVLGTLTFAGAGDAAMLAVGTGACGAFTTFSSFSVDAVELWEADGPGIAAAYAIGTLLAAGAGLLAAWLLVG